MGQAAHLAVKIKFAQINTWHVPLVTCFLQEINQTFAVLISYEDAFDLHLRLGWSFSWREQMGTNPNCYSNCEDSSGFHQRGNLDLPPLWGEAFPIFYLHFMANSQHYMSVGAAAVVKVQDSSYIQSGCNSTVFNLFSLMRELVDNIYISASIVRSRRQYLIIGKSKKKKLSFFRQRHTLSMSFNIFVVTYRMTNFLPKLFDRLLFSMEKNWISIFDFPIFGCILPSKTGFKQDHCAQSWSWQFHHFTLLSLANVEEFCSLQTHGLRFHRKITPGSRNKLLSFSTGQMGPCSRQTVSLFCCDRNNEGHLGPSPV